MGSKKIFYDQLKASFYPLLRGDGFTGSGQDFRRHRGEVIHAINIQNNRQGGSCCVNLGVHFTFLPVSWNGSQLPDLENITVADCEFRIRLTPAGELDYWWTFKGDGLLGSPKKSVSQLCEIFQDKGQDYFNRYSSVQSIIDCFPPGVISKGRHIDLFGGVMPARAALTMARIYRHRGDINLQKHYASLGLQVLGDAKGLEKPLEELSA